MTRTLARQMSDPVPSPSMNGMMGLSGTTRRPFLRSIALPFFGTEIFAICFSVTSPERVSRFAQFLWKTLLKSVRVYRVVMRDSECFSELHHGRAHALG